MDMRAEIVEICAEALRGNGFADASAEAIARDPRLATAALELLRDCRPLPVVRDLIAELEAVAGGAN
jgi:hypothetical protein